MNRSSALVAAAIMAIMAIGASLWTLRSADAGHTRERVVVGGTPAVVYRPLVARAGPVIVIAHGFAGSQQLMQPFATTFARNGYTAITFDFAGHGRNPRALTGNITDETGATQTLVAETSRIADFGRTLGDGRLVVLGHSMASDIIVRVAQARPDVAATIAVSMFSPAVTRSSPRNLLVIAGDCEGMLKAEALRAVGLASVPAKADRGVTYGTFADGSARRAAFSGSVEHVGVLYSRDSMREALAWVDASFGIARVAAPYLDQRGAWIVLLLAGIVLLAWPLSVLLPVVSTPPAGAGLDWRELWLVLLVPAVVTPLLLRVLPTHFLPVLVADYLAVHFVVYGLITAGCLVWTGRWHAARQAARALPVTFVTALLAVVAFEFLCLAWPLNQYVTSFVAGPGRFVLVLAMLVGTVVFFVSDEWVTRGDGAARGAYLATKIAFLVSLALAVALDFERLFFLMIIVPVIVAFFVVGGLISAWCYRRTGHPWIAGIANALLFAWAIAVTFPLLAG